MLTPNRSLASKKELPNLLQKGRHIKISVICVRSHANHAKFYYTPSMKTGVYGALGKQKSSILSKNGR